MYRPKRRHAAKSSFGRTTPSALVGLLTPAHEKDRFLGHSRPSTPGGSRAGTPDFGGQDSDDDRDATLVQSKKKGKARTSWVPHPRGQSDPTNLHSQRPDLQLDVNEQHRYPPSPLAQSPANANAPPARAHRRSSDSDEDAAAIVQQAATSAAKVLKSAMLHDARGIRGTKDGEEALGGLVWNVTSSHEAKRLARSIWTAFREPGRGYLIPTDLVPAFGGKLEEAKKAFAVFDTDNNGDLSRAEIKTTLLKVYKERRFLSRSMRDVGEALKTLDGMLLFMAFLILFFISLSVFGVNIESSLTSLYTIGIGASFIFKNSASNAFDAIMFLFVTQCVVPIHFSVQRMLTGSRSPFDTGDRCFIDGAFFLVWPPPAAVVLTVGSQMRTLLSRRWDCSLRSSRARTVRRRTTSTASCSTSSCE